MLNAKKCWKAVLARDRNGDLDPVALTLACLVASRRKSSLDHPNCVHEPKHPTD
jgi:hypothetical protein